ncbi:MAG: hypothetical protein WDW36_005581 [Sanguina aurantia]
MSHIKSFGDLDKDSDSEDDGKVNEYYAGGAKSGQMIRGAPEPQEDDDEDDGDDRVGELFKNARKVGARQGTSQDLENPTSSTSFQGTSHSLTGRPAAQALNAPAPPSGPQRTVITFYRNGIFTVNSDPPRRIDDPVNFAFITSISKGECPEELETGMPIEVSLVRNQEDYKEAPKPKPSAFQGTGHSLGGSSSAAAAGGGSAPAPASDPASEWKGPDDLKPTTSIQLRLADGSRAVVKFNHSNLISDIRAFIRASRPDLATGSYSLMTAFPPKVIADESATLEAAGLLNAVITQKR